MFNANKGGRSAADEREDRRALLDRVRREREERASIVQRTDAASTIQRTFRAHVARRKRGAAARAMFDADVRSANRTHVLVGVRWHFICFECRQMRRF